MDTLIPAVLAALAVWLGVGGDRLARLTPVSAHVLARAAPARRWRRHVGTRRAVARADALVADLPAVCDLLAVCIQAGRPPRGALRVVADVCAEPTRGVLLGVWNEIDLGVPEHRAWASLADVPGYRGFARDVGRAVGSGAALADLLRERGREARAAAAVAARARARTVAVTGVLPLVVCYLPAFLLVGVVPIFGGLLARLLGGG
nr:type II secretion system F family protein [Propionibacterium sp.]